MDETPVWGIASCLVAVLAIAANGSVIFIIVRRHQLHTTSNWFVLSLAVADFSVAVVSIPHVFLCAPDDRQFCQETVLFHIYWFFVSASTANVCTLGVDRLISVQWSLRYIALMTTKRISALITTSWVIPLSFALVSLTVKLSLGEKSITEFYRTFCLIYISMMVIIPTLFLLAVTVKVIYTARKLSQLTLAITAQLSFNGPRESVEVVMATRESKARSSMLIVVGVFSCFVVFRSIATYWMLCSVVITPCTTLRPLLDLSQLLYVLNSALNPIACSLLKNDLKNELRTLRCNSGASAQDWNPERTFHKAIYILDSVGVQM